MLLSRLLGSPADAPVSNLILHAISLTPATMEAKSPMQMFQTQPFGLQGFCLTFRPPACDGGRGFDRLIWITSSRKSSPKQPLSKTTSRWSERINRRWSIWKMHPKPTTPCVGSQDVIDLGSNSMPACLTSPLRLCGATRTRDRRRVVDRPDPQGLKPRSDHPDHGRGVAYPGR